MPPVFRGIWEGRGKHRRNIDSNALSSLLSHMPTEKKCLVCSKVFKWPKHKFCSKKCAKQMHYTRFKDYHVDYTRKMRGKYAPGKTRCKDCGLWFKQIRNHISKKHI